MLRALRLSAVLALLAAVTAGPAAAQLDGKPPDASMRAPDSLLDGAAHDRRSQISAYGVFNYGYGFGLAARYALPIFKDGFIPELNESIEVEAGGDFIFPFFGQPVSLVVIAAEPRWTFHITPQFDAYFKLGIAAIIPLGISVISPVAVLAAVGGSYKIGNNLWLRLEASNFVVSVGAGLDF